MQNIKETEIESVHIGLTSEQAADLLKSSKVSWVLCIGNIVAAGKIRHSGTIVAANQIDPVMLSEPVSPAHPHLKKVYTLAEGLEMLAAQRVRWDGPRLPAPGETLTVADEIRRLYPTFARPMW